MAPAPGPLAASDRPPDGRPISASVPFLLFGLGRLVERELEVRLADQGLSLRTVGVLGHLDAATDLSYSALARRADVTVQTMHATVRRLVAEGLVSAEGSTGQAAALSLTGHGRARLRAAAVVLARFEEDLLAGSSLQPAAVADTARNLVMAAWRLRTPEPPAP